ncbi:MAG TPA: hypothetical protein VLE73_02590 [Candidatus Saccharimonadales bacterium]|nr:hypothetical protein [Candidatus Saccharimonadales bacterium]
MKVPKGVGARASKRLKKLWRRYGKYAPIAVIVLGLLIAAAIIFMPSLGAKDTAIKPVRSLSELASCKPETKFQCYSTYFQAETKSANPKTALAEMQQLYDQGDEYVVSQCHQLAHQVGHAGYDKYGSLGKAFENGDNFCWSGYYHGITEQAVGKMGRDEIKKQANNICKDLAKHKRYSFDHYNCVHGLGHGFMAVDNYNLFTALKTCDLLKDSWERSSCYGGVFMENVMVDVRQDGKSDYLKPDQPMYPCTAVAESYKYQCYLMQTSYALKQNSYNFADGFRLCRDVADPAYTTICYQSLGRDASGSTVSDIAKTKEHCDQALDYSGLENCMLGAVRDFISYYHSDAKAKQFCAVFEPTITGRCLDEVTSYYATFK